MWIRAVKIFSIAVLMAAAVLGILFDFRTPAGTLTEWGVVAIAVTLASAVVASLIEFMEFRKDLEESRVDESRERERQSLLSEIRGSIQSGSQPLTPLRVLCTIRYVAENEAVLDEHFAAIPGYKAVKRNELLKRVGVARLGEQPFNFEEESPVSSECTLNDPDILAELVQRYRRAGAPIWLPDGGMAIEFRKNGAPSDTPFVSFETISLSHKRPGTVRELRLYDQTLYQDTAIFEWEMSVGSDLVLGIRDLKNTTIKVSADFFLPDRSSDDHPPTLTNLLLYFGNNPTHLLHFPLDRLKAGQRALRRDPRGVRFNWGNEMAKDLFQPLSVQFESHLDEEFFTTNMIRYAK